MTQQVRGKWHVANSASLANNKAKPQEIRTSSDLADADARMVAAAFDSYVTKYTNTATKRELICRFLKWCKLAFCNLFTCTQLNNHIIPAAWQLVP